MKQGENVEPMPTLFFPRTMITNTLDHKCDQLGANDVKLISNQRHDFRGFGELTSNVGKERSRMKKKLTLVRLRVLNNSIKSGKFVSE